MKMKFMDKVYHKMILINYLLIIISMFFCSNLIASDDFEFSSYPKIGEPLYGIFELNENEFGLVNSLSLADDYFYEKYDLKKPNFVRSISFEKVGLNKFLVTSDLIMEETQFVILLQVDLSDTIILYPLRFDLSDVNFPSYEIKSKLVTNKPEIEESKASLNLNSKVTTQGAFTLKQSKPVDNSLILENQSSNNIRSTQLSTIPKAQGQYLRNILFESEKTNPIVQNFYTNEPRQDFQPVSPVGSLTSFSDKGDMKIFFGVLVFIVSLIIITVICVFVIVYFTHHSKQKTQSEDGNNHKHESVDNIRELIVTLPSIINSVHGIKSREYNQPISDTYSQYINDNDNLTNRNENHKLNATNTANPIVNLQQNTNSHENTKIDSGLVSDKPIKTTNVNESIKNTSKISMDVDNNKYSMSSPNKELEQSKSSIPNVVDDPNSVPVEQSQAENVVPNVVTKNTQVAAQSKVVKNNLQQGNKVSKNDKSEKMQLALVYLNMGEVELSKMLLQEIANGDCQNEVLEAKRLIKEIQSRDGGNS